MSGHLNYNWITPKAEVRRTGGKGWGSVATEHISAGETVAAFGGWIVTRSELDTLSEIRQHLALQIDADLYLVCRDDPEPGELINHSCAPNCGLLGSQLLVAMRDIDPGEELSFDYAMCDATDYDEFTCLCEEPECRGVVTGSDWRLPHLQDRYAGWFSPYLVRRIAALPTA